MSNKKRYAIVGTGSRAGMYVQAIEDTYHASAELVGLCDLSQTRMDWYNNQLNAQLPTYHPDDFDKMVEETKPDTVIVTTIDAFHHEYIVRAMETRL